MKQKRALHILILYFMLFPLSQSAIHASAPVTETIYLSGRGCDDMKDWDFYCTGGKNSGKWSRIGVPSCWELQGFGTYQYGYEYNKWNKNPSTAPIADEKGLYRHRFFLPGRWQGRRIELVFEAAMTDTEVKINGITAGEIHQGGFSPFRYDISDKVRFGDKENLIEVCVSKESSDPDMNLAERRCDYWNFGGIIRPVYIEARPASNIARVAIDGDMHGNFKADCFLNGIKRAHSLRIAITDIDGNPVSENIFPAVTDSVRVNLKCKNPALWNAETPNLYHAEFTLLDNKGNILHTHRERFGFRTIELRKGEGFFINGKRVRMKGINRHSFRPESGRTLSFTKNLEDALLIKELNMNAVRLSHYPADKEFYDICDSIGLYVIDELTGWQHPQKTEIGRKLVMELVTRDVNHPSVILWASGNEGGFNYELEPDFKRFDIQNRIVIYPWSIRDGLNTRHYRSWDEMRKYLNGPDVVMPTEFLHGLYDGGLGSGLHDYWSLMKNNNLSAGGFLWALYDEGVIRTDKKNKIDTKECFGPDGIVGPHGEREGSFFTVKQIWSPVQVELLSPDSLRLENCYDFSNLEGCMLKYRYLRMPGLSESCEEILTEGVIHCPPASPGDTVSLRFGNRKDNSDCVEITVSDHKHNDLFTWRYRLTDGDETISQTPTVARMTVRHSTDTIDVTSMGRTYRFSKKDGELKGVTVDGRKIRLENGPRLIAARRCDRNPDSISKPNRKIALAATDYTTYPDSAIVPSITVTDSALCIEYSQGYLRNAEWKFLADGNVTLSYRYDFDGIVDILGIMFDLPEESVTGKRWVGNGPYRVWQNRLQGPQYGYWQTDYNNPVPGETFEYPEFKGYFANVDWMEITTSDGKISLMHPPHQSYVGVFNPIDGRDNYLYKLPESGISILEHIPAVRNKVDYSDLNGPSAQPHKVTGEHSGTITLRFD